MFEEMILSLKKFRFHVATYKCCIFFSHDQIWINPYCENSSWASAPLVVNNIYGIRVALKASISILGASVIILKLLSLLQVYVFAHYPSSSLYLKTVSRD
jgi:hypothetical protein